MRISVIFTGGTIGSTLGQDGFIAPDKGKPYKLLEMYQGSCKEANNVEFRTYEPYRILSENMNSEYFNRLTDCVREVLKKKDSEGIVLTHGTDTLQYTAALLSYVFGNSPVPIVLVSSDFPVEDKRANGLTNFIHAVEFIQKQEQAGVFVSYCNQGEEPRIYRGTALLPHLPYYASVYQPENICFRGNMCYNNMAEVTGDEDAVLRLSDDVGKILWIRPYVGMKYPELSVDTKVVLHDSYHSGTICVNDDFRHFMEQAKQQGIPVYLTGGSTNEKEYETVKEYSKNGIQVLPKMSPIAAYCKLWLAISNGLDTEYIMKTCIAEDLKG